MDHEKLYEWPEFDRAGPLLAVAGVDFAYIPSVAVMTEQWREIPGFPTYEVSSLGRVKSRARIVIRPHPKTGKPYEFKYRERLLAPANNGNGYLTVNVGGTRYVHRLVLFAFVGPEPAGCEACHINGQRADNRASNLRWDTAHANAADRDSHGTTARGERGGQNKFGDEVRARIRSGAMTRAEALAIGVSPTHYNRLRKQEATA